MLRRLGCLIFGHAPIVEINEVQNTSAYICERCRVVLGDFVTIVCKPTVEPAG
jgi:hypothetical protein